MDSDNAENNVHKFDENWVLDVTLVCDDKKWYMAADNEELASVKYETSHMKHISSFL